MNRLSFVVVCLLAGVFGVLSFAGSSNESSAQSQEKTAEQVYRNIQFFKGLPASQLLGAMNFMAGSLGVSCNHCHVPNQFAKDDKPAKQTARDHLQIMRALNDTNFGGKRVINCATCHRGETRPASVVTLRQNPFASKRGGLDASATLPTVDEILDKYVQAIGGRKKIGTLQSLTMKGARETRNGGDPPATEQLEVYRKRPDKLLMNSLTPGGGNSAQAFNGTGGWRRFNGRVSALSSADLLGARRDANFYKDINFKEQYPKLLVIGKVQIGDRDAFVIAATFAETHPARTMFGVQTEKLYFDVQSGLLIRRYMEYQTPLGELPEATDYEDYRKVNGLMFPFTVRLSRPPLVVTQRFAEIKINAPVEDALFEMPAAK